MVEKFSIIAGLDKCMSLAGLDEDRELDCMFAIGVIPIRLPKTVLDAFASANLIRSKSEFRRNIRPLWINSIKVDPNAPWTFGTLAVLTCGSKKIDAVVVWLPGCREERGGVVIDPIADQRPENMAPDIFLNRSEISLLFAHL